MRTRHLLAIIMALMFCFPFNVAWAQEEKDAWGQPLKEPSTKLEKPGGDQELPKSVAEVIERVDPSVVFIMVRVVVIDPRDNQQKTAGFIGSGFFVSENGYILTNAHVVTPKGYPLKKRKIQVKTLERNVYDASLIKQDIEMDLALLRINKNDCPAATLGDPFSIRVGDQVIAIGNPSGLEHSATTGIISAFNRQKGHIQTSALIYHGNSGGPLFNIKGEVIGVVVSGLAKMHRAGDANIEVPVPGINFAIPINHASNLLQLMR